jgi:hypothetical protein
MYDLFKEKDKKKSNLPPFPIKVKKNSFLTINNFYLVCGGRGEIHLAFK